LWHQKRKCERFGRIHSWIDRLSHWVWNDGSGHSGRVLGNTFVLVWCQHPFMTRDRHPWVEVKRPSWEPFECDSADHSNEMSEMSFSLNLVCVFNAIETNRFNHSSQNGFHMDNHSQPNCVWSCSSAKQRPIRTRNRRLDGSVQKGSPLWSDLSG
jgi:hypothetical protein